MISQERSSRAHEEEGGGAQEGQEGEQVESLRPSCAPKEMSTEEETTVSCSWIIIY